MANLAPNALSSKNPGLYILGRRGTPLGKLPKGGGGNTTGVGQVFPTGS
jgi:hypothetical protein